MRGMAPKNASGIIAHITAAEIRLRKRRMVKLANTATACCLSDLVGLPAIVPKPSSDPAIRIIGRMDEGVKWPCGKYRTHQEIWLSPHNSNCHAIQWHKSARGKPRIMFCAGNCRKRCRDCGGAQPAHLPLSASPVIQPRRGETFPAGGNAQGNVATRMPKPWRGETRPWPGRETPIDHHPHFVSSLQGGAPNAPRRPAEHALRGPPLQHSAWLKKNRNWLRQNLFNVAAANSRFVSIARAISITNSEAHPIGIEPTDMDEKGVADGVIFWC